MKSIVWFRQDLRVADNPALSHAAARGQIIPVYILDESPMPAGRPLGGASRWWLHKSLGALEQALGHLVLLRGKPGSLLSQLVQSTGANGVYWNRCYEPYAVARDTDIKNELLSANIDVASFNGSLLHEPWEVRTQDGGPYKVFTPFWRACQKLPVGPPLSAPKLNIDSACKGEGLADWQMLPSKPDWAKGFAPIWTAGEAGASGRLEAFLTDGLAGYAELRNRPDLAHVSRMSPHLHFGEISPRQIWAAAMMHAEQSPRHRKDVDKFLTELGWREFSYHLLYHFPTLPLQNLKQEFDAYPWVSDARHLKAWQRGSTGYPLVDAGMRELWTTGYMHNRVRMVVASFLIKHLRIDWREGEKWFWDTLVDADLANNSASWQWVAGSGADAAPYFRIFNPVEQGRKFDPEGVYVRRWCPELARLPDKFVHAPFEAPPDVLNAACIALGHTYPEPIVGHSEARAAALAGYEAVKAHKGA
jgi:deoxyribodipyrimidine photo-lyase